MAASGTEEHDGIRRLIDSGMGNLSSGDYHSASDEFATALRRATRDDHELAPLALAGRIAALVASGHFDIASRRLADAPPHLIHECRREGIMVGLKLPDEHFVKVVRLLGVVEHEHPWTVLNLGAELASTGRLNASRGLLGILISQLGHVGDRDNRHRAIAQLGRTEQIAGNIEAALDHWSSTFRAGSTNRKLALWYSRELYRRSEFAACADVCSTALQRIQRQPARRMLEARLARARRQLQQAQSAAT